MQIERQFRSLSEWIKYSETIQGNDGPAASRESIMASPQWTGTPTKEKAYELFYMGDPALSARMREILGDLVSDMTFDTIDSHFENDIQGASPDVEAYIQGRPEDMFVMSQTILNVPPTFLPVQLELCFSANFQPDTVMMAGAIIHAAVTALQMQGCHTEITVTHTVRHPFHLDSYWQSSVPLPASIDLDSLAFILAHPSTLRRIVFSIMEHEPPETRDYFGFTYHRGYSCPSKNQLPDQAAMLQMQDLCKKLTSGANPRTLLNELIDTRFHTRSTSTSTPTPNL